MLRSALLITLALGLTACISPPPFDRSGRCVTESVTLDADFDGGGLSACRVVAKDTIDVLLEPEDEPINPSPWYALRLTPNASTTEDVTINLIYTVHPHRYQPKVSPDGRQWTYLDQARIATTSDGMRATLTIPLDANPVYVAGQELLTQADYSKWLAPFQRRSDLTIDTIGHSVENRPLTMVSSDTPLSEGSVVLVGRQHPPELTGAIAMLAFVEEVLGDSALAERFRGRFNVYAVPFLNPDGVKRGYWRHNTQGTDLNRDWGPFVQPETRAIKDLLDRLANAPATRPVVFLDFHSTRRNVFYTQFVGEDGTDYRFTQRWLSQSHPQLPNYVFGRAERPQTDLATSKNYVHGRFSIPAITYEVGDETDRVQTDYAARVFAREMMRVLLEHHRAP
ncbi:MAG: M14 family zinc carboxypeptidase [Pseudomonadota bacterium]